MSIWQVNKTRELIDKAIPEQWGKWTGESLLNAVRKVFDAEVRIKTGKVINPDAEFENLLLELFRG
jgi:DNA polymerase III delta subunit